MKITEICPDCALIWHFKLGGITKGVCKICGSYHSYIAISLPQTKDITDLNLLQNRLKMEVYHRQFGDKEFERACNLNRWMS